MRLGRHDESRSFKPLRGLIETGANRLCVPPHLLTGLELLNSGTSAVQTATALVTAYLFVARLLIPKLHDDRMIEVVVPHAVSGNTPVLVGMSILSDFTIWYHGGLGTWSFYRRTDREREARLRQAVAITAASSP